ncbi:MAG: RICIN domain-containing protein [Oscillibacter sp.]|nr:RICIN domain-containing protein [Oscillibacter sp.]
MKKSKKIVKQLLSLLLVLVSLLLPVVSAGALYSDYPSRWNTGTFDSDMGQYVANIAKAQDTKTGENLGYISNWCAKFVVDCGEKAGTTALNPPLTGANTNAWVPDYYKNLLAAGGKTVSRSEAKAGDIAFFDWNYNGVYEHVEIVYDVSNGIVYTVGGNTGGNSNTLYNKVNKRTTPGSARDVQSGIAKIVRPNYPAPTFAIIDGEFFIGSAMAGEKSKVLDIYYGKDSDKYAKNVQICGFHGGNNQKFRITHLGDGWHRIESILPSSKSLDVEGNYSVAGTNVIVWGNHDGDNQRWRFIPDGNGFLIQSKLGFYLDVYGGFSSDETNVQIWDKNGGSNQCWQLFKTSDGSLYKA